MSNDLNQCNFIGRLGKDVDLRYTPAGDPIAKFSIAVGWKSKDKEGAEWVNIVAFGKLAEICGKHLKKGSKVFVSGSLKNGKYKDNEGKDRYTTEIRCNELQFLDGKPQTGGGNYNPATPAAQESSAESAFDDDIPFISNSAKW